MKFVMVMPMGCEGPCTFLVDDNEVGYCDHDSHGWEGMASMRDMFCAIAETCGVEVEEIEGEGND